MLTTLPKAFPTPGQKPEFGPWFGISASKANMFRECPRAWWLSTNQGWQGWASRDGQPDPASKLAYVLGKLNSLYGIAGNAAGDTVYAYLEGKIERAQLLEVGLALFDRRVKEGVANSTGAPAPCERDPKKSPGLEEWYYSMVEPHRENRVAKARKMVEDAMRGAAASEYLARMRAGTFGKVSCESGDPGDVEAFWLDGIMTWVTPDILCNNGVIRVIDLKAGQRKPEHALQVQIYALWAAERYGKPVKGFLIYLAGGERVPVDCSPEALDAAKVEMVAKAAEIQALLVDPRCNLAPREKFHQNLRACKTCKFFEACHGSRERK